MCQLHGDGHEAAKAPALDTHAILVHIGQRLEELDALHLVGHLDLAEVTVGAALKLEATVVGTTVVEGEDHIALLRKEHEVEVGAGQPAVGDELRVGTAIDVYQSGVFLATNHIGGRDEPVV